MSLQPCCTKNLYNLCVDVLAASPAHPQLSLYSSMSSENHQPICMLLAFTNNTGHLHVQVTSSWKAGMDILQYHAVLLAIHRMPVALQS
jgi:hypothetical protein